MCDVCKWVFGEGWITTKVMIMVAKPQHVSILLRVLGGELGFSSLLSLPPRR